MGLFEAAHGWEAGAFWPPLPKICHTHPTMMKPGTVIPYLRRTQNDINHVTDPLSSNGIIIFSPEISKFCCIKKYGYILDFDA